jgi:hypothetical protein
MRNTINQIESYPNTLVLGDFQGKQVERHEPRRLWAYCLVSIYYVHKVEDI